MTKAIKIFKQNHHSNQQETRKLQEEGKT